MAGLLQEHSNVRHCRRSRTPRLASGSAHQPALVPASEGLCILPLMTAFICTACGTQYPPSETPPDACLICTDERQFVPPSGQSWTTLERLRNAHSNNFRRLAAGLVTIETTPAFGIGQRAILA